MARSLTRSRGVTLVEVVLATGIAALFLTAFMVQFRLQQTSYEVASDELRLPVEGYIAVSRLFGTEGFSLMYRPTGGSVFLAPSRVQFYIDETNTRIKSVYFDPSPADPRPDNLKPGGLKAQVESDPPVAITAPALIATMSFYSPELFKPTANGTNITYDPPTSAGTVIKAGGSPAFYVLGAAGGLPGGGKELYVSHAAGTDGQTWRFRALAASRDGVSILPQPDGYVAIPYSEGGTFILDLDTQGTIVCSWPIKPFNDTSVPLGDKITYTLDSALGARRVGFWLKLNTSPYSGLIAIRDSFTLRNVQ